MNLPILPIIKSVTDLRYQTAEIINLLKDEQPVVVTRENKTVAVVLSPIQYQKIVECFDELEDERASRRLEEAIEKGGEFADFNEFDRKERKKRKI